MPVATLASAVAGATVAAADQAPSVPIDIDPAPNAVPQGAARLTPAGLMASSTDPNGGEVRYSLIGDTSGGGFQIDAVSVPFVSVAGRVTVLDGSKIRYDGNPSHSYQLTVEAMGPPGLTSTQTFTVVVTLSQDEQDFLSNVYHDLLHRTTDTEAMGYWTGKLAAGESRAQVVLQLEQSPEFDQQVVQQLFSHYLHRAAESSGVDHFTTLLETGATIEQVSAMIAGSDEFFAAQGGGTNDGFLGALYQDALGRPIDAAGLASWSAALTGGASRIQVAGDILASGEYHGYVVELSYKQLLGRPSDPAGAAAWTGLLNSGATDQQVFADIAGSDEYYAKSPV